MPFVKLTRMLEKKVKSRDRGDLRAFAYAEVGPVWVRPDHVVALSQFKGPIFIDDDNSRDGVVTELLLVSSSEPLLVSEPIEQVLTDLDA